MPGDYRAIGPRAGSSASPHYSELLGQKHFEDSRSMV